MYCVRLEEVNLLFPTLKMDVSSFFLLLQIDLFFVLLPFPAQVSVHVASVSPRGAARSSLVFTTPP